MSEDIGSSQTGVLSQHNDQVYGHCELPPAVTDGGKINLLKLSVSILLSYKAIDGTQRKVSRLSIAPVAFTRTGNSVYRSIHICLWFNVVDL